MPHNDDQVSARPALHELTLSDLASGGSASHIQPFLIAAVCYVTFTAVLLVASYWAAASHFVFALDDTYINMAMAKNFALHGVWGVTPFEFSSSTSAPLYVLLLSFLYRVFGVSRLTPLLLSCSFGLGSLYVASRMMAGYLSYKWNSAALLAVLFFTPLFAIGILGMEPTLEVLLTLLFLEYLFDERKMPALALIAGLLVGTRYEGLFVVAVGIVFLLLAKRPMRALAVAVSGAVPVIVYAVFSIGKGGVWLPNSVALKGTAVHNVGAFESIRHLASAAAYNIFHAFYLFLILTATAIAAISLRNCERKLARLGALVAGAGLLHLACASVGAGFRYEDYLVAAGIVVAACMFPALRQHNRSAAGAVAFLFFCSGAFLFGRALDAAVSMPEYSRNIYLQQYQTAEFLQRYYPETGVAANDIGLINFRAPLHSVDLVGLASGEVFRAKREQRFSTEELSHIVSSRNISVAVVYDIWFIPSPRGFWQGPSLPSTWIRVARWKVPQRLQLGDTTVSFYAVRPEEADALRAHLRAFEPNLPSAVQVLPGR